jgi:hypothetical protein
VASTGGGNTKSLVEASHLATDSTTPSLSTTSRKNRTTTSLPGRLKRAVFNEVTNGAIPTSPTFLTINLNLNGTARQLITTLLTRRLPSLTTHLDSQIKQLRLPLLNPKITDRCGIWVQLTMRTRAGTLHLDLWRPDRILRLLKITSSRSNWSTEDRKASSSQRTLHRAKALCRFCSLASKLRSYRGRFPPVSDSAYGPEIRNILQDPSGGGGLTLAEAWSRPTNTPSQQQKGQNPLPLPPKAAAPSQASPLTFLENWSKPTGPAAPKSEATLSFLDEWAQPKQAQQIHASPMSMHSQASIPMSSHPTNLQAGPRTTAGSTAFSRHLAEQAEYFNRGSRGSSLADEPEVLNLGSRSPSGVSQVRLGDRQFIPSMSAFTGLTEAMC